MGFIQKALKIFSGSAAIQFTSLLLGTLVTITLTRTLGVKDFGIYSVAYSVAVILCVPVQAGLPTLITREIARYQQSGRTKAINALLKWSFSVALVLSSAVILISTPIVVLYFNEYTSATLMAMLLVPVIGLSALRSAALKGLGHVLLGQLPDLTFRPIVFITLALIAFYFGVKSPELSLFLHSCAAFLAFLVGAVILIKVAPKGALKGATDYSEKLNWKRSIYSISLVSGVQVLNANAGILVLGAFGTVHEVGVFKVAYTCALLLMFGRTAVLAIVQPYLSRYYYGNQLEKLKFVVAAVSAFSFAVMIPALSIVYFWGDSIVEIAFGVEYVDAVKLIIILSVGQIINSYFASVGSLLMMSGNERHVMIALVSTTLLFVPVLIISARTYGAVGTAVVISAQIGVVHLIYWSVALIKTGVDCGAHALLLTSVRRHRKSM